MRRFLLQGKSDILGITSTYVGGLVGSNRGTIKNSYATSSVNGDEDSYVGGLVGFNSGYITNSYTTGSIKEFGYETSVGGLIGSNFSGSITTSYWDKWTSGQTASGDGEGKTTVELQEPTTATGIYRSWSTNVWDFGTTKQYPVLKYSDGTVMPNQSRERPDLSHRLDVEIAGVPAGAVNEGEPITLTASSSNSASIIPLDYGWSQISGGDLLVDPTSLSSVTIEVPEDYVSADANTVNLTIMLLAVSDVGSTSQHVSITIAKRNNGKIASLGAPSLNERELTASSIDLSGDPDGGGSNISYQWQSRESSQTTRTAWINIPAGTSEAYTIADDVKGIVQYRVVVSYTDGQGYDEKVVSRAVVYERRYSLIEIASLTSCGTTDIDQDDDGLIEICNLEGLNAIRYQLDGSGYRPSSSTMKITAGCPATGCKGYELAQDLDFNDDNSYSSTSNKITWTTGTGWQPIGTNDSPFNAIFKANKHSISNLMIDRPAVNNVGLFGRIGGSARIESVALINVNVRGNWGVGSLVGLNSSGSVISNSYATGTIRGGDSAGGLVGDNYSRITNSYTNISVSGGSYIGGIVGCNFSGGTVTNSYTVSSINSTGGSRGGILGYNGAGSRSVVSSYWDMDVSGISSGSYGLGRTTIQLQSPTAATGIYSSWSTNVWDFGTTEQYPALKYRDGMVLPNQPRERPDVPQMPQVEIAGVPTSAVDEGYSITLTASSTSSASIIPLDYRWSQVSGGALLIEPTSLSSVTIEVPEDYVSAGANTVNLAIMLEAVSDVGITTQQVSITIAKRNNGKIAALGAPSLNGRELTAPAIDLSGDPDGGGSNISYQWQSRESTATAWANVPAGTNGRYTIAEDYRGSIEYRVVVNYTDGQGYDEEVISDAVVYEKIDLPISVVNPTSCDPTDIDQDNNGLIEICNLEGLNAIRYQVDGTGYKASYSATKITAGCGEGGCRGYELIRDLDFNNSDHYQDIANKTAWTTGAGWQPMRLESVFEGNNHTIANLMIDREQAGHVGLFGVASGSDASINGVGLIDVDIKARISVGGLVGAMFNGVSISNSYATGDVVAQARAGGLVGDCSYSAITDSNAKGTVSIGYNSAGGLAGYLLVCEVSDSHALSAVKGFDRVGGLVGENTGSNGRVSNSYAIADVEGRGYYAGGLIGFNSGGGIVISSYAMGEVVGADTVGGLVGYNAVGYTIRDSYSFAAVKGSNHVGGLVGHQVGGIINSYSVGSVIATGFRSRSGGLVGLSQNSITTSYWDKTTSGKAQSAGSGEGKTTAQLQSPTTATGIYSGWDARVWDFGTSQQYPALKRSDGTLMPGQRIGLLGLSVFTSDEIPYMFNSEVFDYRLLIANEMDTIELLPTATSSSAVEISIISDNGFSESVSSGSLSSEIPLATTGTTLITVKVKFASQASRSYRLTISRADQSALAQLVGANEPFDYVFSRNALNDMQSYEVLNMPEWLEYEESESGLMFSGTPSLDYMGSDYMDGSSEQMLELQIDNGDGTTETISIVLQIDSPTTGTVELVELPGGVLQLNDGLSDDNGIVEKTHIWEHCPVGADEFNELEGVDGMSYTLPGGEYSAPGTAYRVRTTVVDGLGQRSELTTQIELRRVIKVRIKVFLEGFLQ